jgi:sterol desaturase/sphingolipid hydroxylase (fatty acid hydroxylase superfamily)|tara:strand:- start:18 stop:197 length:180 start_codon:yes stop_codon:yes gene_type:complete
MGILSKFWDKVTGTEKVQVRSRNKKGHYVADDKSTPDINEAYTTKRVKKKSKININNTG